MYHLFETIKTLNGKLYNLKFHEERFRKSYFEYYNVYPDYNLIDVINVPDEFNHGLVKTRFTYNNKIFDINFSYYSKRKIETLKIINSDIINYSLKFNNRDKINELFELRGNADDIIIIKNGLVTDTSNCNIILENSGKWFTPAAPLLKGTCRERLLREGRIFEKRIKVNDLNSFDNFALINAMISTEKFNSIKIDNILL